MTSSAVFVVAVALQNKMPLSGKFSRNPGSMSKTYAHVLSTWPKYMAGFLVKSFEGWPSSNCILLQKICLCQRSSITTVRRWCWTPSMVCAVTTPLHSLYQGSPHYGPWDKSDQRSHFTRPQNTFANNEKIIYLRKMCCFGRMWHIPKKSHYTKCVALELLCNSLWSPLPKAVKSPCLYELDRQTQTRWQGRHCWELQGEPFAFCGRIGTAFVDLLNRVFSTHFIGFLLRATKQERKSSLKRLRYFVS